MKSLENFGDSIKNVWDWTKENWWKVVLGIIGAVILYWAFEQWRLYSTKKSIAENIKRETIANIELEQLKQELAKR